MIQLKKVKNIFFLLLFFILLISIFISLGFWQLTRAQEKKYLLEKSQYNTLRAMSSAELKSGEKAYIYSHVALTGHYDSAHTFFLSNQFHQHVMGFHVVTPFVLENHDVILVDRGFVPRTLKNPPLDTPNTILTLQGKLKLPSKNRFLSSSLDSTSYQNRLTLLQFDLPYLSEEWQQPLLPFVLLLDSTEPFGFVRDWLITAIPPERHQGYAVQWFALALLSTIILVILIIRQINARST